MNRMLQPAFALLAMALATGCQENPTEVTSESAPLFNFSNKPSRPPGGGGGGGGGGGTGPADPVIAYRASGALRVMNSDGSNSTVVAADGEFYAWPSWAPFGAGSSADPYRLVFSSALCGPLATIDLLVEDGTVISSVPETILTSTSDACESEPAWSPDGNSIVYSTSAGGDDVNRLALIPAGVSQPIAEILYTGPGSGAVFSPTWSPGSDAIAFSEWDGGSEFALKIFHLGDGMVTTVVQAGQFEDPLNLDWSRTGAPDRLAFHAVRINGRKHVKTIYTLDLEPDASGHYQAAASPEQRADGARPTWSPDDAYLAVDGIALIEMATSATTSLRKGDLPDWRR